MGKKKKFPILPKVPRSRHLRAVQRGRQQRPFDREGAEDPHGGEGLADEEGNHDPDENNLQENIEINMEAIEREELAQKKADDLRSRQLKIFPHQYITKRFVKDT